MGRPRKPAVIRFAEGNRSKTRIPDEPDVDPTIPTMPSWLSPEAKKCWKRLAPKLHAAGLLLSVDGDALAAYCDIYAQWREVRDVIARDGSTCQTFNSAGRPCTMRRPEFDVYMKCIEQMIVLSRSFGMSPAARTGLPAGDRKRDVDPFTAALGA